MTDANDIQSAARRPRKMAREPKAAAAGEAASTAPAAGKAQPALGRAPTKASIVDVLLKRAEGASLDDLCEATDWLPHTCRAFLTGLRKKGKLLDRGKRENGTTFYRLTSGQQPDDATAAPETGKAA